MLVEKMKELNKLASILDVAVEEEKEIGYQR